MRQDILKNGSSLCKGAKVAKKFWHLNKGRPPDDFIHENLLLRFFTRTKPANNGTHLFNIIFFTLNYRFYSPFCLLFRI